MSGFTFIDCFSGIGGFRRGLEANGGTCVFSSEIDKFAAQAYEALYGDKPHGDITQIEAKDIPDHDIMTGGFPCQSFSVAGKRGGFEDARGTLFFEIARIASEKQPKVLLLENVKGLVGHDKGKTLDTIVRTLNYIGYRVDFDVLNSKYFGVPQNRERIFIIAVREDLVENEPWIIKGTTVVPKGKRRISEYDGVKTFNFDFPTHNTVTTRLRDVLETNVDEKYYLSEEKTAKLVAQLAETPNAATQQFSEGTGISYCLDASYTKGTSPGDVGKGRRTHVLESEQVPRWIPKPDEINRTLRSGGKASLSDKHNYDHIAEEIQDQHGIAIKEATTKGYAVAAEGDAVNFQFPDSKTRRGRVGKGIANTLEASGINQGVVEAPPKYRIRKLTPLECFRLQAFPDEAHQALVDVGISDSQRYKMAGNAVTVNVVQALGERLVPFLVGDPLLV